MRHKSGSDRSGNGYDWPAGIGASIAMPLSRPLDERRAGRLPIADRRRSDGCPCKSVEGDRTRREAAVLTFFHAQSDRVPFADRLTAARTRERLHPAAERFLLHSVFSSNGVAAQSGFEDRGITNLSPDSLLFRRYIHTESCNGVYERRRHNPHNPHIVNCVSLSRRVCRSPFCLPDAGGTAVSADTTLTSYKLPDLPVGLQMFSFIPT